MIALAAVTAAEAVDEYLKRPWQQPVLGMCLCLMEPVWQAVVRNAQRLRNCL